MLVNNAAKMAAPAGDNANKSIGVLANAENVLSKVQASRTKRSAIACTAASAGGRATMSSVLPKAENAALRCQPFIQKLESAREVVPAGNRTSIQMIK